MFVLISIQNTCPALFTIFFDLAVQIPALDYLITLIIFAIIFTFLDDKNDAVADTRSLYH